MECGVDNTLITLNNLDSEDLKSEIEAKQCVLSVKKYVEENLTSKELDLFFSSLFDDEHGIIYFLKKKIDLVKYKAANVEAFSLLNYLLENHSKSRISQHILQIKHVCMLYVSMDHPSADEKDHAFDVLLTAVRAGPWDHDLEFRVMLQKLLAQVASRQKPPAKVLQKAYHLIGRICRYHPECADVISNKILKQFLYELEEQTCRASKVEFSIITGCMNGLTEYLHSFPPAGDNEKIYYSQIYKAVKKLAEPSSHRKVANRAAMSLVSVHGGLLADNMFREYKWWHELLQKWIVMSNEEKKVGFLALDTFYEQMALVLEKEPEEKEAFMYLIEFLRRRLTDARTPPHELRVTIKAFGQFAGACQAHMSEQDVAFMFTLIVQRIEQIYIQNTDDDGSNFSVYLISLATIMTRLAEISRDQLLALERIAVSAVQSFPRQVAPVRAAAVRALTAALHCMSVCRGNNLDHFARNFVYQGIVRTCSHPIFFDAELLKDDSSSSQNVITYKSYVPLWNELFTSKNYHHLKLSFTVTQHLVSKIYDEFIFSVLMLMKKLDLQTRKKVVLDNATEDTGLPMLDLESSLEATTPKDFNVFVNLVDLCRDVLLSANHSLFEKWIYTFCYRVVEEAYRKPLVSGFYKLLSVALDIAGQLKYFAVAEGVDNQACLRLVSKFLQQVLGRQSDYKGDLQVACLQAVLGAPSELVVTMVPYMHKALQVIFQIGGSFLPLAHSGLDALERWNKEIPAEQLKPLLGQVLQYLDPFLQSKGYQGDPGLALELGAKGRKQREQMEDNQGELSKLQGRIVKFVGQVDSKTAARLVTAQSPQFYVARDERHLTYALPFIDMKPGVHLDELAPRVIELALKSSDRRTRVMACELLHAIVMYMLGQSALLEATASELLESLFDQLALPLLQLGCDADQVVNQLFQPLVLQLVHWYSSKYQLKSKQSARLLEALLTGITHETDTAVRDFSAKCLREFVVWSIKQLSAEELVNSPVNIKAVIKRIHAFCLHPSATKRLGAALIFNSIYTVLREEETIVDQFWMEILYYMVVNLATLAETNAENHLEQVASALDHIERVLRVKADLFNKTSALRRIPPDMNGALLKDAVAFLAKHCGSVQPECRHKCMQLVCSLAPCTPDFGSASKYVNSLPPIVLLGICENGSSGVGISTLAIPTAEHSMENHLQWLSCLLASLECYVWLIDESLADPDRLFTGINSPKVIQCLNSLDAVTKVIFSSNLPGEVASPWELEKYIRAKCSVVIRTFEFTTSFLRKSNPGNLFRLFSGTFSNQLFELIQQCVFDPNQLGFEMDSSEVTVNLPVRMEETLKILKSELSNTNELTELEKKIKNSVNLQSGQMLIELQESFSEDVVMPHHIQFVNGLHTLQRCKMLTWNVEGEQIVRCVFGAMIEGQTPIVLQPKARSHAERLVELSFAATAQSGPVLETLVRCLLSQTQLRNLDTQSEITHGEHFLSQVKVPVMKILLESADLSSTTILSGEDKNASLSLIIEVLQHLAANRKQFPNAHVALEAAILRHWTTLSAWASADSVRCRKLIDLLSNMAGVLPDCVDWLGQHCSVSTWVFDQIGTTAATDLHHKNKALELLPCLSSANDEENAPLALALKSLKDQHFPQSCSELSAESIEQSGFVTTFQNILLGLEISGSRVILRSLIAMCATDNQHICEPAIQSTLAAFVTRLNSENQLKAIQLTFDIFSSEAYNVDARLGCVRRFTATLLQSCEEAAAKDFFRANIMSILAMIDVKLVRNNEWKSEQQLGGRIGAWLLVEMMFARIDKSYLENTSCPITAAVFPGAVVNGKELIVDLTRRAVKGRQETSTLPLFRASLCAAYNALSAIISNVKTEAKFYSGLLFAENRDKQNMIWDRIVDTTKTYAFPLLCDELPTKRKQLVGIRKRRPPGEADRDLIQYIPTNTQYLFNSTLNEDVTRFDFSNCVVRSFTAQSANRCREPTSMSVEISLEDDELNGHECMATVCAVIRHMAEIGVSPVEENAMPPWMESLKMAFVDRDRHRNVNLFIAKLILNCEENFKPYAKFWVGPIMEAISEGACGPFGNSCLVNDLIAMAASWGGGLIDKNVSCAILELLMSNCDNERREIFRHYLELTRTFVEIWKDYVDVPHRLLLEKLSPDDRPKSRGPEVGIQLAGIFLANGIAPWNNTTKEEFLRKLLTNLRDSRKAIYQPCSEVIGYTLRLLHQRNEENESFLTAVHELMKHLSKNSADKTKFIVALYGVHKYHPAIVDPHMTFITFNLPKLYGTLKTQCLEMLCARVEVLAESAYTELKSKGLHDWLKHDDSRVQELALRMIFKIASSLDRGQLANSLTEVCRFTQRKSVPCRRVMYETLMWVDENRQEHANWLEANNESRATLIRGLVDSDVELQKTVFDHWRDPRRLPPATPARLAWLLGHLHTTQTEPHFLGNVVGLVLELAAAAPDFERAVFPAPLHECHFAEYRVLVSWRAQHATIAPMFAQTMASQLAQTQATQTPGGPFEMRATVGSLAFAPTLQGHGESHRTGSFQVASSLLFTVGSSHIARRGDISVVNDHDATDADTSSADDGNGGETSSRPRSRRFLRDESRVRFGFAGAELRRQARRDTLRQEQARRRDANVSMMRRYRIGDFPDIEITNAAILKPLQALVKRDAVLARQCFVSLFAGVVRELEQKPAEHSIAFADQVTVAVDNILSATTRYTPTLVAALLQVALDNSQRIHLDTDQVSLVARKSGLASLGCLLLEERIISMECEEPTAKRTRNSKSAWTNLAELYRSVGCWDMVRAIFQRQLTACPRVQKALDAEAAGNWLHVRYGLEGVRNGVEGAHRAGVAHGRPFSEFERHSYFKCLAHLAEWELLETEVHREAGGDAAALWSDGAGREELLPLLVRSRLRGGDRRGARDAGPRFAPLDELVRGWLHEPERAQHLANEFSEELSVLYALKKDYDRARFYGENKKSIFLEKWSQLSLFSRQLRADTIVDSQTLGEILSYLSFSGCTAEERYKREASGLVRKWNDNLPASTDSLLLWDTRITYRCHFLRQMREWLPENALQLDEARSRMELSIVKLALGQKNLYVARKYIQKAIARREGTSLNTTLKLEWILNGSRVMFLRAEISDCVEEKEKWLVKSWRECDRVSAVANTELSARGHLQNHCISRSILKLLQAGGASSEDLSSAIRQHTGEVSSSNPAIIASLEEHAHTSLRTAANVAEDVLKNGSYGDETQRRATVRTIGEAYLELAKFNRSLARDEDVATAVLRAMRHDSRDARQLFPWILEMPALAANDASFRENFVRESNAVPEWMFLSWTNQILGCLDSAAVAALEPLVLRLATAYPNAVKHAFRLSAESFKFATDGAGDHTRLLVARLNLQLKDDMSTEGLLEALSCFGQPEVILKYHLTQLISLIDKRPPNFDFFINKCFLNMMKESFISNAPTEVAVHGRVFAANERYRASLQEEYDSLSMEPEMLRRLKDTLLNTLKDIQNREMQTKEKQIRGKHNSNLYLLKDYSPWLHNFKASKWNTSVEIPGQYDGETKPLPQHHVTIAGFHQNVEKLPSSHCPIRISIIGNDAREYPYLVKFGEDLRQDQRIQQLFCLMNKVFNRDTNCGDRNLVIATYQVIPLSSRHGLIQWITHTKSLKKVMEGSFKKDSTEAENYGKILNEFHGVSIPAWSKDIFLRYSRDKAIADYQRRVNMVPWDIFRRATRNLCRSPEEFFSLRQSLVTSYSTMAIGHWILGIGDRHLSNCLIDTRHGCCLGIDFGFAFGTATHVLGMPELMPFRLTPHVVNLMQPMKEHGLFRETMLHCLRALRHETARSLLLATMEVFIREPSIDWRQHAWKAMRNKADMVPADDQVDIEEVQFARVKISACRRKLEGANPAVVTCADLRLGGFSAALLDKYNEVALGDPSHNVRARLPPVDLSAEDQVNCLLDQATDQHLLAKTYIGWEPWV